MGFTGYAWAVLTASIALTHSHALSVQFGSQGGKSFSKVHGSDAENGIIATSLNGAWSVTNANKTISLQGTALVPGDIYTDLQRNGIIGDPLVGYGDVDLRWVGYDNWTYSRIVDFPERTELAGMLIVFEGLQVVADIFIDGKKVGHSNSDFKPLEVDVWSPSRDDRKHCLLEVVFTSSAQYALKQFNTYPSDMEQPVCPAYLEDIPHRNFIRAEQSSFGWDWGPAFAPMGIFGDVTLYVWSKCETTAAVNFKYIRSQVTTGSNLPIYTPLTDDNNAFTVELEARIRSCAPTLVDLKANITSTTMGDALTHFQCSLTSIYRGPLIFQSDVQCFVFVRNVPLWWPRGYGEQALQNLTFTLLDRYTDVVYGSSTIRLGFRAAELITVGDPLKEGNTSIPNTLFPGGKDDFGDRATMFFRINGVPIYAKGSNVIPYDAFRGRTNNSVVDDLLESALLGNQNILRVWGGGLFKEDYFYRRCDEEGILVWQEMMFACSEYPIDNKFLVLAKDEIAYQIGRLSQYSSIVLWSGSNEDEIYDKGPGSPYEVLAYDTVIQTIISQDNSRPVRPSSPSVGFSSGVTASGLPSGTSTFPDPFTVGKNAGGSDTHFYNYFKCADLNAFPNSNFASEYGFQSLPWFDNLEGVSTPVDWSLFSDWMNHRQHHPNGNEEIAKLLEQNFPFLPNFNATDVPTFKRTIFLSQLLQAFCIGEQTAFYRRGRNMPYRTMGAMYWQLNQNWQAPSWTSTEYGGEWKILHYAMREAFLPVRVTAFANDTDPANITFYAHILNDHREAISDLELVVSAIPLLPLAGVPTRVLYSRTKVPVVAGNGGIFPWFVTRNTLLSGIAQWCPKPNDCVLEVTLKSATGKTVSPPYTLWLSSVKEAALDGNATVSVKGVSIDNPHTATIDVHLSSQISGPAVYVFLRTPQYRGYFSENLLTLVGGDTVRITFNTRHHIVDGKKVTLDDLETFVKSIEVQSLNQ